MGEASRKKAERRLVETIAAAVKNATKPHALTRREIAVLIIAVASLLVSAVAADLAFVVLMLAISGCAALYLIFTHQPARIWTRIIVAILVVGVLVVAGLRRQNNSTETLVAGKSVKPDGSSTANLTATALFMECDLTALPITVPAHGRLSIIPLNRRHMKQETWGFYDIPNDTSQPSEWPDKKRMNQSAKVKLESFPFGYKCDVSNHGAVGLTYAELPIDLWFEKDGKSATEYRPLVSALDPGKNFEFYIVNDCPTIVSGAYQDTAKVLVLGESAPRTVLLHRTYKNPAEQIMMFMPNNQPWIGQLPCEK